MNALLKKVASLLPELETRGEVYLFAMSEREDVNRWDLVLSSKWSDDDYASAVRIVASALGSRLGPTESTMLSRISIIPSDDPRITTMPQSLEGITAEDEKLISVALTEVDVRRTYIFKARRPHLMQASENAFASAASQG